MSEEHDYREQYNEAIARAVAGQVGVYPDFDRHRQETVWRVLSTDRQALLTFCQRQGISVGRMDTASMAPCMRSGGASATTAPCWPSA